MNGLIGAREVGVFRGGRTILANVSLEVGERCFVTVIGPNGAGKSMLLKCLMGIYPPDRGTVARRDGLKIGYMPQQLMANPAIPISARRFLTLRKKATPEAVRQAAAETGVGEALEKPLHTLSSGELQRILLTRALLGEPALLVLDEPAQNLDVTGQLAFYRLLERIYKERPLGILMVSHDLHLVMASTRRVVCLLRHVCCAGEPRAVARDPEFVSLFGDDMARLMAAYHHYHDHSHERGLDRERDDARPAA